MSKIGKVEWLILYIITGLVDLIQIIIDLTGIGIAISEVGDKFFGVLLVCYFQIRGVSLFKYPSRIISLLGIAGLETITGGIAPAWIADIWYIHRSVKHEEKIFKAQQEETEQYAIATNLPLNQNGVRNPQPPVINSPDKPMNRSGIRQPRRN
jgi:hypothetical protein